MVRFLTSEQPCDPQHEVAYFNRGNIKEDIGDNYGAIEDYGKAIAIDPGYNYPYINRGIIKDKLGDTQGAISDYDNAIAVDSQNPVAYLDLSAAKSSLGSKQGAIMDYGEAITLDPQYYLGYYNRANVRLHLTTTKEQLLTTIRRSRLIRILLMLTIVVVLPSRSWERAAIIDHNQAISLDPQYQFAYVNRGIAKQFVGEREGACRDFKTAIALGHQPLAEYLQSDRGAWCRNMR